jgi:hypothetical protein
VGDPAVVASGRAGRAAVVVEEARCAERARELVARARRRCREKYRRPSPRSITSSSPFRSAGRRGELHGFQCAPCSALSASSAITECAYAAPARISAATQATKRF